MGMTLLLMCDLDKNGKPLLTNCHRCGHDITRSKFNNHYKVCSIKKADYIPRDIFHPTKVDDKPKKLSNMYYGYPRRL